MKRLLLLVLLLSLALPAWPAEEAATPSGLLEIMAAELQRSMKNLGQASDVPLYYLQYTVTGLNKLELEVRDGGLFAPERERRRYLDVDLRVGSMELDNTHEIRGSGAGSSSFGGRRARFPLSDDPATVRAVLWNETEARYHQAQERFTKVLADRRVLVEEEDLSHDFSPAEAQRYSEKLTETAVDVERWQALLKRVGVYLAGHPFVRTSGAGLTVEDISTTMVNSEGSRLEHGNHYHRLWIRVLGMAKDGMELRRNELYSARSLEGLPGEAAIMADAERLVSELKALIDAPVVEPYIGPAILRNRASGVFFHEIFGHRIEGHRQKSEREGQTFTKKVGQQILPEFISIHDDATMATFGDTDLRGFYRFDDEGTPAQRVTVVEQGVLRNFLTTRSPIANFPRSNGHARREYGSGVVARQGNLIISSQEVVPYDELRRLLVEECKSQGKPYGLVFDDISGGFTRTRRGGTQSFKVLPLLVHRVYADGRPDEVVRGVDIVGTPLTSFSKILMAGDDDGVFNGTCGAESGSVPVSAISPSILVGEIEVEKRTKGQDKPPILPPPAHGDSSDDPVFHAMSDELERSMERLVIEEMARPYFISYLVQDNDVAIVEARYGAILNREESRDRYLYTEVRVGDPSRDNTGYIGGWRSMGNARTRLSVEDDYQALRHQIWLETDGKYKLALENLAGKKAYLQTHPVREPLDDFSRAEPLQSMAAPAILERDLPGWEARVKLAAQTLGEFSSLQDWKVRLYAVALNKRYLNSEGSRHRKGKVIAEFEVSATTQAADGQRLTSFLRFMSAAGDQFPTDERLAREVRAMAGELEAMTAAEIVDGYSGPVLFSGEAAAQFVSQLFAVQLSPPRKPLLANQWMSRSLPQARLAGKLNRRVFPEFVTITDDPNREAWEGRHLAGHLQVDDEGVATLPVTLVRDGRLVGLPMGRQPTREVKFSNGHVWASPLLWPMPMVTNLLVETSNPVSNLTGELRRLAGGFGLDYGLLVTRLDEPRYSMTYRRGYTGSENGDQLLAAPVGVYKVYVEDGRMEPVRGLVFEEVTLRAMRDVKMMGDDPRLTNLRLSSISSRIMVPASVVTPSILVGDMDLKEETTRETVLLSGNPMFGE